MTGAPESQRYHRAVSAFVRKGRRELGRFDLMDRLARMEDVTAMGDRFRPHSLGEDAADWSFPGTPPVGEAPITEPPEPPSGGGREKEKGWERRLAEGKAKPPKEPSLDPHTEKPKKGDDLPETFQEVKGKLGQSGIETTPPEPAGLALGNRINRVINQDIVPITGLTVASGTAGDAYSAKASFDRTSQRVDILAETYPLDVQLYDVAGITLAAFKAPVGTPMVIDGEFSAVRVKENGAGENSVYQVIAWY